MAGPAITLIGSGGVRSGFPRPDAGRDITPPRAGNEPSGAELGSARFGSASERAELGSARYFCEPENQARLGSVEAREPARAGSRATLNNLLRAEPSRSEPEPSYEPRAIFPALPPPTEPVNEERPASPPPSSVIVLDSPEDQNAEPLTEALPSNAEVPPPNMEVGATREERGPSTAETATTDTANAQPIPETDRSSLVDAGILSSDPVISPLPTSDAAAPPPDPKIGTATRSSRGAKATAGFGPSKLSSVEALGLLAAEVTAQGGVSSELAACTQNVKRREFEFGWLRRVAMDVATVMHAFVGPSFVEMELREECQALRAQDQAFAEVRQGMDEELASTRRALEDKQLEQLRKECDELRDEHQATEWEREVAVQEHDAAIQERDVAIQGRDAAIQERDIAIQGCDAAVQGRDSAIQECATALSAAEEASERGRTALSSLQNACNESDDLRQELVRIEGQKNEAEATVASLAVDVASHRATQQRLETTVVRLQNEAAGKCPCRVILLCPFNGSFDEAKPVSLAAAKSLRQEAESKWMEMKEALESQITGSDNLRLAVGLVLDDLGMDAAGEPGQEAAQLINSVDGVRKEAQAARQEVESAREEAESARQAARDALFNGVHRAFAVARSHYLNIDLAELSKGYMADYTDAKLDAIEEEAAPFARTLTDKVLDDDGQFASLTSRGHLGDQLLLEESPYFQETHVHGSRGPFCGSRARRIPLHEGRARQKSSREGRVRRKSSVGGSGEAAEIGRVGPPSSGVGVG
ncbi:hypothetical protein PVAP13_4KG234905 [Panicum virgatum]|uniref:Uncharacterized protein n=1 Tax=Panicum virgatum TaxID=38727 RepID=A0A8T0TSA8_PANVG|nr:hypothetical protein PVAP13_4KG234905 [Panicum virgatum]